MDVYNIYSNKCVFKNIPMGNDLEEGGVSLTRSIRNRFGTYYNFKK